MRERRLLAEFLHERDALCPACGYNLRNIANSRCPECREPLALQVGCRRVRIGVLLALLAPCMFAGIGGLLLVPLIIIVKAPPLFGYVAALGLASGMLGLAVATGREWFIERSAEVQYICAVLVWSLHLAACVLVIVVAT